MAAQSRRIRIAAVIALIAIALLRFGDRAAAIHDPEYKVLFGPVGITPGERALVNVYSVGNPDIIGNPDVHPWEFVVRVFNRRGEVIQERRLQLATGAIGSVDVAVQDEDNGIGTSASCVIAHFSALARITDNYIVFQVRIDGVPIGGISARSARTQRRRSSYRWTPKRTVQRSEGRRLQLRRARAPGLHTVQVMVAADSGTDRPIRRRSAVRF